MQPEPRPPNVLWIMADQLRYAALGFAGDPNVATPNIDRLAAQGTAFHGAVSQYPVCVPYRASLMTGLHSPANGAERHGDFIDPSLPTVATAMGAAGYRTCFTGKWHLAPECNAAAVTPEGWIGQEYWVHPRFRGGFQRWFGFNISNNYERTYIASGERLEPRRLEGYQTDALTDLLFDHLRQEPGDRPWFHVLSYESPHPGWGGSPRSPMYPAPEAYEAMFDPEAVRLRPNVPEAMAAEARVQMAGYYRLITNLDDNVGRILAFLDEQGWSESTLVVFHSDHGEMGGSHGLRNKQVPFEESVHVPLLWRWPGQVPAGGRYEGLSCGVDIYPTIAGLCGVPMAGPVHGLDHAAVVCGGGSGEALREDVLLQWEAPRFGFGDHPYRGIRTRRHTYVVGRDEAFCLLFDRDTDPYETQNLFGDPAQQALAGALHARLVQRLEAVEGALPVYVGRFGGA